MSLIDYDAKAEDAVNYEDIEEQYEGPEVQATSEEDYLLPKKDFFSSEVSLGTAEHTNSVFDDENYDEDVECENNQGAVERQDETTVITTISGLALILIAVCFLYLCFFPSHMCCLSTHRTHISK